jgi:hypothetical protein
MFCSSHKRTPHNNKQQRAGEDEARHAGVGFVQTMISHGAIHSLPELCQNATSMNNQSVRVLGR